MVGTLVAGGLPAETTIAAIVLARAVLLLGTIAFGWGFYQHSVATAAAPALTRAAR
jgi:Flp pilus assembly protein TadG